MKTCLHILVLATTVHVTAPTAVASELEPFEIKFSDTGLEDLKQRLKRTRWPGSAPSDDWSYGVPVEYMQSFVDYWANDYDWRKVEAELNRYDQYLTEIDGLDIHFLHVKSPHEEATPLLLVHGWPGSFVEFREIIKPLTDPVAYGGKKEDAFHLVIPSLPGFGFSEAPSERGWSYQRMASVMPTLMQRLNYTSYGVQGGDWGAGVAIWLGINDGEHVLGVHVTHPGFPTGIAPDQATRWEGVSEQERKDQQRRFAELSNHRGYQRIQETRPQTLGYGLHDSPSGLAAWILDKFYAWSDHQGDFDSAFSRDELITNIMIYWISGCMPSSARVYYERPAKQLDTGAFAVPIGAAVFPQEIQLPPRKWFERKYGEHVKQYTIMPRGGHFAAMEEPDLLIDDVRRFFRLVRKP